MSRAACGTCDTKFSAVREAFEQNLRRSDNPELGASFAVVLEGKLVVDLWGGTCSEAGAPWKQDTLCCAYSVGKAFAALSILLLYQRGELDLDAPVARYWPEFGAADKEGILVRHLLTHQCALPALRQRVSIAELYDWERMTSLLAAERPWWSPGDEHGYHVNTYGFLLGELVRRVTGRDIESFFRREVAGPLDAEFYFALPREAEERVSSYRLAALDLPAGADADASAMLDRVYENPVGAAGHHGLVNDPAWRRALHPGTSTHSNARSVARIFAELAPSARSRVRVFEPGSIDLARGEQCVGPDRVLGRDVSYSLGFQRSVPTRQVGPNPNVFFKFAAGGALGAADPDHHMGFAYIMNSTGGRWLTSRNLPLIEAVYASL